LGGFSLGKSMSTTPLCLQDGRFSAAMKALWPHGDAQVNGLVEGIIATAPAVFAKYQIPSDSVVAIIMAQFSEESGAGTEMIENMNYSAARLLQVFPSHFSHAEAIALQHQPRLIADQAYGGRMGNAPPPSDDGWKFRGQGLSQCTGKDSYVELSKSTGLDLVNHPEFLCDPQHALDCALGDFVQCGCMPWALKGNFTMVTQRLNGGQNGASLRVRWWALWKHALGVLQ
jgi:putative chitinase